MAVSPFIEDIFERFYDLAINNGIPLQHQDRGACSSFYDAIVLGKHLTQNQQRYVLRILEKYRLFSSSLGFDYEEYLNLPQWRNPARIIDQTKKVWVEEKDSTLWLCFKFPFVLKTAFEREIENKTNGKNPSIWDHDNKIRRMPLYTANLIQVSEFVFQNTFDIDPTFSNTLAQWEEVLDQQESIVPHSKVINDAVELVNASSDAQLYWQQHITGNLTSDLLLAKQMGYLLVNPRETAVETIASSNDLFWINDNKKFFDIYKSITGRVCIVLDRVGETLTWLKNFIASADREGINRNDIKVLFRETRRESGSYLNDWIKEQGLGGRSDQGKILIFQHKPAKWLFKEQDSVTMLVSNNIYPPTNNLTREWLEHHPCAIFLGDIKPSQIRNRKIVQL